MPNKPNYRIHKIQNAKNLARPMVKTVVELKKPGLEMHIEPPPTGDAPDTCTGNPMCYCVGV
ncbi:hypothetical protein JW998_02240, partial [candidate division KSB1 bacterium]|nr:hypothetical protein [candidate division KSB1 bacterium]